MAGLRHYVLHIIRKFAMGKKKKVVIEVDTISLYTGEVPEVLDVKVDLIPVLDVKNFDRPKSRYSLSNYGPIQSSNRNIYRQSRR